MALRAGHQNLSLWGEMADNLASRKLRKQDLLCCSHGQAAQLGCRRYWSQLPWGRDGALQPSQGPWARASVLCQQRPVKSSSGDGICAV